MSNDVVTLRTFNRRYTQRIGVLAERFLGQDRPPGAARVLFEIGPDEASVLELRQRLDLDSGYLSRVLRGLEAEGLVTVRADDGDARRRVAALTARGRREWDELDRRSNDLAAEILDPLTETQRRTLTDSLATADRLLRAATVNFDIVDPRSDAALFSMTQYFDELDARFPSGFDPGDTLMADAAGLRPPVGVFVVAVSEGRSVACGGVQALGDGIGEIKRMWVDTTFRGLGVGRRMLSHLEGQARGLGHRLVRLDTNSELVEAIAMYESAGYRPIERYNDNPYALRFFEKAL